MAASADLNGLPEVRCPVRLRQPRCRAAETPPFVSCRARLCAFSIWRSCHGRCFNADGPGAAGRPIRTSHRGHRHDRSTCSNPGPRYRTRVAPAHASHAGSGHRGRFVHARCQRRSRGAAARRGSQRRTLATGTGPRTGGRTRLLCLRLIAVRSVRGNADDSGAPATRVLRRTGVHAAVGARLQLGSQSASPFVNDMDTRTLGTEPTTRQDSHRFAQFGPASISCNE